MELWRLMTRPATRPGSLSLPWPWKLIGYKFFILFFIRHFLKLGEMITNRVSVRGI
jgi:hypothetical protein